MKHFICNISQKPILSKTLLLPILFSVIAVSGFGIVQAASVDYFLKIEGVDGESTSSGQENAIEIQSFSWGMSNADTTATSSAGAGKVQFQDFHFTKEVDKSSPLLLKMSATGEHIKSAKLTLRKAGSDSTYLVITLQDIMVSSYSTSGDGGAVPTDQISLNFEKIEMEYVILNADGRPSESYKSGELKGHVTLIK
jgi:type VI secretion system secreted protein Hcp